MWDGEELRAGSARSVTSGFLLTGNELAFTSAILMCTLRLATTESPLQGDPGKIGFLSMKIQDTMLQAMQRHDFVSYSDFRATRDSAANIISDLASFMVAAPICQACSGSARPLDESKLDLACLRACARRLSEPVEAFFCEIEHEGVVWTC
jgi:hypothetical protein